MFDAIVNYIFKKFNSDSYQCGFPKLSFTNKVSFTFSGLITLDRISNTILNRSVESGQSYLVLDTGGKLSVLHQLSVMLDVGFS